VVALAAYTAGPTPAEGWLSACGAPPRARDARVRGFVDAIDFPETKAYVLAVRKRYAESLEE
jgi:soluble lytic murein transglycosylase-like protein